MRDLRIARSLARGAKIRYALKADRLSRRSGPRRWIEELKSGDRRRHIEALKHLRSLGPSARVALPALIQMLSNEGARLRPKTIAAIGAIAAAPVTLEWLSPLNDSDVRHLGSLAPPDVSAIRALRESFEDDDEEVRLAVIQALSQIAWGADMGRQEDFDWEPTYEVFLKGLEDESADVRAMRSTRSKRSGVLAATIDWPPASSRPSRTRIRTFEEGSSGRWGGST